MGELVSLASHLSSFYRPDTLRESIHDFIVVYVSTGRRRRKKK